MGGRKDGMEWREEKKYENTWKIDNEAHATSLHTECAKSLLEPMII